jgi:CheY-like chemotaxis protein
MFLQQAVAETGLAVDLKFVADGEQLLDYLHRRNDFAQIDVPMSNVLVLMDLNMPRLNGDDALKQIRADRGLDCTPVVIFSTSSDEKQIAQSYENGANAFITKPADFNDFVAVIRKLGLFWFGAARLPLLKR